MSLVKSKKVFWAVAMAIQLAPMIASADSVCAPGMVLGTSGCVPAAAPVTGGAAPADSKGVAEGGTGVSGGIAAAAAPAGEAGKPVRTAQIVAAGDEEDAQLKIDGAGNAHVAAPVIPSPAGDAASAAVNRSPSAQPMFGAPAPAAAAAGTPASAAPAPAAPAPAGAAPAAGPAEGPPAGGGEAADGDGDAPAAYHTHSTYLTPADLRLFRGEVKVVTEPRNSQSFREAYLSGQIFHDCSGDGMFQFETYSGEQGTANQGIRGFVISDPNGAGKACMLEHRKAGHVCTPDTCRPIRSLGATIDARKMGEAEIRFCYPSEAGFMQCDAIGDERVEHKSRGYFNSAARATAAERKQSRVDRLLKVVSSCTRNSDDRVLGREAMNTLTELGQDMSKWEKKYADKDFDDLRKLVNSADGDIDEIMDKLSQYASEHPEKVESIAKLYVTLGQAQIHKRGATAQDYRNADRIVAEAEKLDGLSKASQEKLKGYHTEITIALLQAMAQAGMSNSGGMFMPLWQNTMMQLQQSVMQSCMGGMGGSSFGGAMGGFGGGLGTGGLGSVSLGGTDMSACQTAMTTYQAAQALPQQAQQADQRRSQFMQQLQAQMSNPLNYGATVTPLQASTGLPGTSPVLGATSYGSAPYGSAMPYGGSAFSMPGTLGGAQAGFMR